MSKFGQRACGVGLVLAALLGPAPAFAWNADQIDFPNPA